MELLDYFKSIVDMDRCDVVICNLEHKIIYMNPAAYDNYAKRGGKNLLGKSLLDCHNSNSSNIIKQVVKWFGESSNNNIMYTYHNEKYNRDVYMVALRDAKGQLIGYYEKKEYRNPETMEFYHGLEK